MSAADLSTPSRNTGSNAMSDLKVPFIDFSFQRQRIGNEVKEAVGRVIDTQQFILNRNVSELEAKVAAKLGSRFAIGVASGSDALYLSLWAMGIEPGDEVIVPPFTFFATAGAVSRTGATPVFADIDSKTFNLDPAQFERRISPKTKAVIPVHLFGLPCDMDAITSIAKNHAISVVEDAAQSFGATYFGRQTAAIGDAGCLSFFPTKNLGGAGDGGMVITASQELADKIKMLRVHGSKKKYFHEVIGINSRLDEMQAAVVLTKLKYIDEWNAARQALARRYNDGLKDLPVQRPQILPNAASTFHIYSILSEKRDALAKHLTASSIGTGIYYPLPLHLQPCYSSLGHKKGDFPVSESVASRILALPMYPELTAESVDCVIQAIKVFHR